MSETIKRSSDVGILGEFWPYALNEAGVQPQNYIRLLEQLGFRLTMWGMEKKDTYETEVKNKYFYVDFFGVKE
jgi:hypothetical protein